MKSALREARATWQPPGEPGAHLTLPSACFHPRASCPPPPRHRWGCARRAAPARGTAGSVAPKQHKGDARQAPPAPALPSGPAAAPPAHAARLWRHRQMPRAVGTHAPRAGLLPVAHDRPLPAACGIPLPAVYGSPAPAGAPSAGLPCAAARWAPPARRPRPRWRGPAPAAARWAAPAGTAARSPRRCGPWPAAGRESTGPGGLSTARKSATAASFVGAWVHVGCRAGPSTCQLAEAAPGLRRHPGGCFCSNASSSPAPGPTHSALQVLSKQHKRDQHGRSLEKVRAHVHAAAAARGGPAARLQAGRRAQQQAAHCFSRALQRRLSFH